jgi:hypothetical protein
MNDKERAEIEKMANHAMAGHSVYMKKWDETTVIGTHVWMLWWSECGSTANEKPTAPHYMIGYRLSEDEMSTFQAEAAAYFASLVQPTKITMHGPSGTEELPVPPPRKKRRVNCTQAHQGKLETGCRRSNEPPEPGL